MALFGLQLAVWSILLLTILYAVQWGQILIFHYRGAFRRIWMWVPIVYLPVMIVLGIVAPIVRGVMMEAYWIASIIVVVAGLEGVIFHVQGVTRQVGGWNLDNVMVGPPVLLPLSLALIGLLGVVSGVLGR